MPIIVQRFVFSSRCQNLLFWSLTPRCSNQKYLHLIPKSRLCTSQSHPSNRDSKNTVVKSLYHKNIGLLDLHKESAAESFVKNLGKKERSSLFLELQKYHLEHGNDSGTANGDIRVSRTQLKTLFLFNCYPFIGFGFLDNAIMIMAGDYIDHRIGLTLGISTMAAAALGNLISDLCGVGLAGYVELLCCKLGLPVPDLTPEQMDQKSSRVYSHLGKAVGITIGCILGMLPLLFLNNKHEHSDKEE